MVYLLDTSVCVSLLRGRATEARLPEVSECALSVITVAELEVGVRRSARPAAQRKAVQTLVGLFDVLPWDFDATFARLEASGFEVGRRGEHWGAPRAKAKAPGGHTVELMAHPPPRAAD